jgi:hypothetical protein
MTASGKSIRIGDAMKVENDLRITRESRESVNRIWRNSVVVIRALRITGNGTRYLVEDGGEQKAWCGAEDLAEWNGQLDFFAVPGGMDRSVNRKVK